MAALGDALTLYDLGLRVAAFINDLRHAQDDFLGLRAEANCLQVCLNSLCSESCQETIYKYISQKQRSDLELILENTLLNMEDLNRFVGGCKYLVANEAKKMARERGMKDKWKAFWKKSWAAYKFAMTDPQPFRDKLVIPTQSLQIFLHSMTHVGLANVGNLLALSGHLPDVPVLPDAPPAVTSAISSWEVIGTKLAFRKAKSLGGATLTTDLEDEILRYVLHLRKGGSPFDAESRTRSKSRNSVSYSRDKRVETYIVRKKSNRVASPAKPSPVVKEGSWSRSDMMPLRLDIPNSLPTGSRSPVSPSSPRIVDARPHFDVSSDEEILPSRRSSFTEINRERRPSVNAEPPSPAPPTNIHSRYTMHGFADVKFSRSDCRKKVEEEIKLEQEEAARELRDASLRVRSRRRTRLSQDHTRIHAKEDEHHESESDEIVDLLEEQYGLRIDKLVVDRPIIDNGTVVPVLPASLVEPDEPVEVPLPTILPKRGARLTSETSFYDSSSRAKRSRYSRGYDPYSNSNREEFPRRREVARENDDTRSFTSEDTDRLPANRSSAPNVIIFDHDEGLRKPPQIHQHRRSASYGGSGVVPERPHLVSRRLSQIEQDRLSQGYHPRVESCEESDG